jgi:hypothetical protein
MDKIDYIRNFIEEFDDCCKDSGFAGYEDGQKDGFVDGMYRGEGETYTGDSAKTCQ